MKLWLDDIRAEPDGYIHAYSVNEAKSSIELAEMNGDIIELLDLDHDLGDYSFDGGDGIKLVLWLIDTGRYYPIKLHTANIVGRDNMQALIDRYWPEEVQKKLSKFM